jgi:ATP-dependent Clp protease ATP-binding subunit ClpB
VAIQLTRFAKLLENKQIRFSADASAMQHIAKTGYDPVYGARPLKRAIQSQIETPVSRMIISGELKEGQMLIITEKNGELEFKVK